MVDKTPPPIVQSDDETAAAWGDETWQEDRQVFERDAQTKVLAATPEARRHWSDKNPKKFTPDVAVKIIQYVGMGAFVEMAAVCAGISKVTYYQWCKAGEDPAHPRSTEELRAWKRELDGAAAMCEARAVAGILAAG